MQKILIIGGSGFIGSHLSSHLILDSDNDVYICSRNQPNEKFWLYQKRQSKFIKHIKCDLTCQEQINNCLLKVQPDKIVYCAGENPTNALKNDLRYIQGNVINVVNFLSCCFNYYKQLNQEEKSKFLLLNVTSYEIYEFKPAVEDLKIYPKTIYSASKATSLHLFMTWKNTYGLPSISAVCANNYGINQGRNKLIPMTILNLLNRNKIYLFQQGTCQRNWIHVSDTVNALALILKNGKQGSVYNISSKDLITNKQLVNKIIKIYAKVSGKNEALLRSLVTSVSSYETAANSHDCEFNKLREDFGWSPNTSINNGLTKTIACYLKYGENQ